jgi:hypothetical protein
MPRSTALACITSLALRRVQRRVAGLLPAVLPVLLWMGSLVASAPAHATDPAAATDPPATADEGSTRWGPIVGACFGVLFGGVLALWQIRSMKNRG